MELKLGKTNILCLDTVLEEIQNSEQTQEIKLPDGMPDIGQILAAWGQVILRGKEWRADAVAFSGGMMVWVLYDAEDGSGERCIDAWIPFQMKWDLPAGIPEGSIRIQCLTRFVDARPVSARKIMVRSGIGALAVAMTPGSVEVYTPEEGAQDAQLLSSVYPVRLPKETGEKTFLQDEELMLPDSVPQVEKLVYYRMDPRIQDKKVLANKVVFRGATDLHILFRTEAGQLHSWDFEVPFSQYADLSGEYGSDAQADFMLCPTSLDLEVDDEGHLRLKCGVVAQYLITDKQPVSLIEDAYSPGRDLDIQQEMLELPAILENRRETLYGEESIQGEADVAADVSFLPDFPRQNRTETGVEMEIPGSFQVLYYGEDGRLHAASARWEGKHAVAADANSRIQTIVSSGVPQAVVGGGSILAKAEVPMEMVTTVRQGIPMVTGVTLGDARPADPNRPSLILRRAGEKRLWDIAKSCGSTVEAIRKANGLTEEPSPNQMLLIPVS